jgi:phosphoribosylformimino-5-aminoimidazole carboxamide ribotide isomerase
MEIYPAIDLIEGSCVRLTKGRFETSKRYYENPVEVAKIWQSEGAAWLHIIDLDGARTGVLNNLESAIKIKHATGMKIQFGGGIRNFESLEEVLSNGIDRAILGTRAIADEDFLKRCLDEYGSMIIPSIDYGINGIVLVSGWAQKTEYNIINFIPKLENLGIKEIIITDISRDGTLEGVNPDYLEIILKNIKIKVIIAGGITALEDITRIKKFENSGVSGAIIGKALYEGTISLSEAIKIAK